MSRAGIDYDDVKQAAVKLLSQGIAPSVQKIRDVLGTGSNTTIAEHLNVWRDDYAKKAIHHLPASLPKELISSLEVLWQTAMEQAQSQLAAYKESLETEHAKIQQEKQDSEKESIVLKQQLADLSNQLAHEIDKHQQVTVDLAISNDRLIKQEQAITNQKQQYEERLARVYAEKDTLLEREKQFQQEIRLLQEKLSEQSKVYQQESLKRDTLHEQSEQRWMQLIDRARQETIDQRKKYEKTQSSIEEKNKTLVDQLSKAQQLVHAKSTELAVAHQQVNQLQKDVKSLETELIKSKSLVTTLEKNKPKKTFLNK